MLVEFPSVSGTKITVTGCQHVEMREKQVKVVIEKHGLCAKRKMQLRRKDA
jgi:hypothetical protein